MKKLSAFFVILILFWVSCEDATEPEEELDTTPPSVLITNPADNATLTATIIIKVSATDDDAVEKVSFFVDGDSIGVSNILPFDFEWKVAFWADGNAHSLLAKATDKSGNVGTSNIISVTISTEAAALMGLSPTEDEIIRYTDRPALKWRALSGAISYATEVSSDSLFSLVEFSATVTDTSETTTSLTQGSHYWRVRAQNETEVWSEWSDVNKFSIEGPLPPVMQSPEDGSVIIGNSTPTMEWNVSEFATLYEANVSISTDFASNEFEGTTTETTLVATTLANGEKYWRVRAQNSVNFWGDWSSLSTFFLSDVIIFANIFDFTTDERDIGNSVQQTADGGYFIIGTTGTAETIDNAVLLIKTNAQGNEEWIRVFLNDPFTNGNSGQQTVDGGYIIVGSTLTFEVLLFKVDANGSEEWNSTFGGSGTDLGNSVQQTSDGGYIITGYTSSFGAGSKDVWLIKTDANGTEEWNKTFGGSVSGEGRSVQQTTDGGYIIAGTDGFDPGPGLLIKTDVNGNEEWNKQFAGSEFRSVQQTSDGGYIIGGQGNFQPILLKTDENGIEEWFKVFNSFTEGIVNSVRQISDGGYILTGWTHTGGATSNGLFLSKTDALGNEEWNKIYGEINDRGRSVQQTSDGGFIITGNSGDDVWLIKTDSEGNTIF
ncbi:hypothetical protein E3V33_05460 [Candidatus Marinimicrobia bacterium MT.SAG.4]|nr:hypothetical protein E3V33_05460 [Candidatus Marinimicrobia bacterium MT.SAG.4]